MIKAYYDDFNTMNSPYIHFDYFITILYSRAEICQIFHCFFGKFKVSKRHSEISWPLEVVISTRWQRFLKKETFNKRDFKKISIKIISTHCDNTAHY